MDLINLSENFKYGIDYLTPDLALQIANGDIRGIITEEVKLKVKINYEAVQKIAKGEKLVYSVNTGFGSLCTTIISKEETGKLQENLLKSHSVGVGNPIEHKLSKIPVKYVLFQNYPNPFNPSTTIKFQIPNSEFTILKVYNILGEEVVTLVSKKLNPGNHTYIFNGSNLASGIYYYQLVAGDYMVVKKMILLK